jgi:hypothetical protein
MAVEMSLKSHLDGAELLQMSMDYNVHIAVTRSPLALRVEGLRASLSALSEHITAVKNVKRFISFKFTAMNGISFVNRLLLKKHSRYPEECLLSGI